MGSGVSGHQYAEADGGRGGGDGDGGGDPANPDRGPVSRPSGVTVVVAGPIR
jgi:hypothetical protein